MLLDRVLYSFSVVVHPFEGFWELKHEKRGSVGSALIVLFIVILTYIFKGQFTAFIFNPNDINSLNIVSEALRVLLPFMLWCISSYLISVLLGGEGYMKDIFIASSYALVPIALIGLPLIIVSHSMVLEDATFYNLFNTIAVLWAAALMISGTLTIHQYSLTRTIVSLLLTIVGMIIITFIALLFFNVIQEMAGYFYAVYREISFRS